MLSYNLPLCLTISWQNPTGKRGNEGQKEGANFLLLSPKVVYTIQKNFQGLDFDYRASYFGVSIKPVERLGLAGG